MAASARVAALARRASEYGVRTGNIEVSLAQVRKRKQNIVDQFRRGGEQSLEKTEGLDCIRGEASFIDARTIEISAAGGETSRLRSEKIFLNTGAKPVIPPIDGLDRVPFLDSTSIMELDVHPEHLVILGGGYVAVEFGQMFRRYGSAVTLIERGEQLLGREDRDVAEEVAKILGQDGIDLRLGAKASRVAISKKGEVQLTLSGRDGRVTITGSHLLIAAGRRPDTDRLNLGVAGVETDGKGYVHGVGPLMSVRISEVPFPFGLKRSIPRIPARSEAAC